MNLQVLDTAEFEQLQPAPASSAARLAGEPALIDNGRRVGVEIEFGDLAVPDAAAVVASVFGGEVHDRGRHHAEVVGASVGRFQVSLDAAIAKKLDRDKAAVAKARAWFGDVASLIVPVEIACPPLPAHQLVEIDRLVAQLRRAGASGSNKSLLYAFGAHLNVETPAPEAATVAPVLAAYVLLEDWLRAQIDVNPSRCAAGFEKRYPIEYQRLLLQPLYKPTAAQLIDDYVRHNPSRNRGLDLLPLAAWLDPTRVHEALPSEKIVTRRAFHYRLPNSEVDEADWSVRRELRRWAIVERLAADAERLAAAAAERVALLDAPVSEPAAMSAITDHALSLGAELTGVAPGERLR